MSTLQYKIMGVVSFLLALCSGIAFFAMRDELARGVGEGPPAWVGPGGGAFILIGVRLMLKKSPDPNQMSEIDLLKHNFGQTRTAQYVVLGVVGLLDLMIVGVTFLGWDSTSNLGLVGTIFLGSLFSICAVLAIFALNNIYNTFGGRARALLDRILNRPQEISHVQHMVVATSNVPGSEHGTVTIHFTDGASHLFQGDPAHAARIVECLRQRNPALPVHP
ncbi:MAG: hypothetical protein ACJAYU_003184 [Bradymonadia bacterium]|jgi:hypothetical protein